MGRIKVCNFGRIMLKIFCWTTVILSIYLIIGFTGCYEKWFGGPAGIVKAPVYWLIRAGIGILVESIIFWIGIIMVYATSEQLGIRWRVLGIVCGWIPVAHLVMLHIIIKTVGEEVRMEKMRAKRNLQRKEQRICSTKYPILMVHGVFFRDFEHLNYWGRIPAELEANGAVIYYGNHNSAAAVRDSAKELAERIHQIIRETGCEKVNVEFFKENPGSFYGWIYFTITFILLAIALFFIFPLASIILIAAGMLIALLQFGIYKK